MKQYYETLGLSENASDSDIKKAYRKLASKHHPDKDGGDEAKFKKIQSAYESIKDVDARAKTQQANRPHNPYGSGNPFADFGFDISGIDPFGNVHVRRRNIRKTLQTDAIVQMEDTLEDHFITIQLSSSDSFRAKVPRGIRHGETIKYSDVDITIDNYKQKVDVLVRFMFYANKNFEYLQNGMLQVTKNINVYDILLGTELEVNTIDNQKIKIKVPKNTPHGTKLKIPSKGLYTNINSVNRNSLLVNILHDFPDLSEEDREIIKKLKGN